MEWLNYHHLLYFWTVARTGSVTAASEELHLASSTISGQIHQLEDSMGKKLFRRSGRSLVLTDFGQTVFRYADEIFNIGRELMNFVQGRAVSGPLRVHVGVTEVVPKLVVRKLLEPVLDMEQEVHLVMSEGHSDELVANLARHHLDIVINDAPIGPDLAVRTFNYLLAESGITFFGTRAIAENLRHDFPESLNAAPVLLPTSNTVVRRIVEQWFDANDIYPKLIGEFQDAAQLKTFGQIGLGVFPAPTIVAEEIEQQYDVERFGSAGELREKFYAVSVEKRERNPAVIAILGHEGT
jgi:LysR family transcriptional activator of nhaA